MKNILTIKRIQIKNFRSIESADISADRLNVIVGLNDNGKSNVLRALDLFFTGGQRADFRYAFDRDFCFSSIVGKNKAKQIVITLTIQPPEGYQEGKMVVWTKVWRRDGFKDDMEKIYYLDGEEIQPRSRVRSLLRAIRFEYVPAIRGQEYFSHLLGNLHDILAETVASKMRSAASSFTETITASTLDIFDQIEHRIGIKSSIQLPADLRDLFSRLDFSSVFNGSLNMSLQQRGDGVKGRHIPILLKYLADQANHNKVPGRLPVYTIWGYEEPENNLELSMALKLAKSFLEYSADIQIFVTTHSPAFYSLLSDSPFGVKLLRVKYDNVAKFSSIASVEKNDVNGIDRDLGLIAFIAPYIALAVAEKNSLEDRMKMLSHHEKPVLFVEGISDEKIITKAFELLAPQLIDAIVVKSDAGEGGVAFVRDMLIAAAYLRRQMKSCGLFDCDDAGKKARTEFLASPNSSSGAIRSILVQRPDHFDWSNGSGLELSWDIEETLSYKCWEYAKDHNWLVARAKPVMIPYGQQISDTLGADLKDPKKSIYLEYEVSDEKKKNFATYICGLPSEDARSAFVGMKRTVDKISDFFWFGSPRSVVTKRPGQKKGGAKPKAGPSQRVWPCLICSSSLFGLSALRPHLFPLLLLARARREVASVGEF